MGGVKTQHYFLTVLDGRKAMIKMTTAVDIDTVPLPLFPIPPFSLQHNTGNEEEKQEKEGKGKGQRKSRQKKQQPQCSLLTLSLPRELITSGKPHPYDFT